MTRVESSGDTPPGTVTRVRRGWPVFTVVAIAIVALFLGGLGGSFQGKLAEVQKNDNASYLPGSAESTIVANESAKFLKVETIPGAVVFPPRQRVDGRRQGRDRPGADLDGVGGGRGRRRRDAPQISTDGTTASVFVPLIAKQDGATVQGNDLAAAEQDVIDAAQNAVPSDLEVCPRGPGGLLVAFIRRVRRPRQHAARCRAAGGDPDPLGGVPVADPVVLPAVLGLLALGLFVDGDLRPRRPRDSHPHRTEPGHPVRAGDRCRHRLRAAADSAISGGTALPRPIASTR